MMIEDLEILWRSEYNFSYALKDVLLLMLHYGLGLAALFGALYLFKYRYCGWQWLILLAAIFILPYPLGWFIVWMSSEVGFSLGERYVGLLYYFAPVYSIYGSMGALLLFLIALPFNKHAAVLAAIGRYGLILMALLLIAILGYGIISA